MSRELDSGVADEEVSNTSNNESFEEVLTRRLSRRGLLKGAGLAASLLVLDQAMPGGITSVGTADAAPPPLTFAPVKLNLDDKVTVAAGYEAQVLLRWGDSLFAGVPSLAHDAGSLNQTVTLQEKRLGYNCDFLAFNPLPALSKTSDRGLLWVNHEYTNEPLMFTGYTAAAPDPSLVKVALAAHGSSIVEIMRDAAGKWTYAIGSTYNRRITGETMIDITGPAAGSDWLKVSYDPTGTRVRGMLNNCGGGKTPWGTVLSAEENFNQYFGNLNSLAATDPKRTMHTRYGLTTGASERGWEKVDSRFDIAKEPNESFRFGWVIEVDPYNPSFTPKKRTALGRFKHEAATCVLAKDNRCVVYTGDDERFDYMYKFVTAGKVDLTNRTANIGLLDTGTLYVAKFNDDGTGRWIPLVYGQNGLTPENGFTSQADVLVYTRGAGDTVGATKMDRPEDIETNPVTGKVYAAMTNNTNRTAAQVDKANPRASNRHGHIIEITEGGNDAASTSFTWSIFLLAGVPGTGDGSSFAGYDPAGVSPVSCPDNISFDHLGNLWIATDGQPGTLQANDGIFAVPVEGPDRGHVRMLLSGPFGCETASLEFTPDSTTLFVSIQHPGEPGTGPNSAGSTIATPTSLWPDGITPPRPSVIAVVRTTPANAVIGS